MKYITLFILFVTVSLFAQVEGSGKVNPYSIDPSFYIDMAAYPAETIGKSRLDVFLKVPYSSVQFVSTSGKYKAAYSVTLTFYDEDKELIKFEKIWNEQIIVDNFEKTNSNLSSNISYRSLELEPGKYNVQIIVEDRDSKRSFKHEGEINLRAFENPVEISDIVFIEKNDNPEDGRVIPSVSNIFTTKDEGLAFFYEVHTDSAINMSVRYKVLAGEEKTVYDSTEILKIKNGINEVNHSLYLTNLSLGSYNLIVELKEFGGKSITAISKKFLSKIYGFPNSILDLDEAIAQMMYIAPDDVIDSLEEKESFDEKLDLYLDYWKRKDPSPTTEENEVMFEYYRRVAYSNATFGTYYPGWKTDMGMVYITLGAPDQVDRHPFDYDSKPYEVWDYYELNKRFVFVDETGFGDYRLINRNYGDWNRYRY